MNRFDLLRKRIFIYLYSHEHDSFGIALNVILDSVGPDND